MDGCSGIYVVIGWMGCLLFVSFAVFEGTVFMSHTLHTEERIDD